MYYTECVECVRTTAVLVVRHQLVGYTETNVQWMLHVLLVARVLLVLLTVTVAGLAGGQITRVGEPPSACASPAAHTGGSEIVTVAGLAGSGPTLS